MESPAARALLGVLRGHVSIDERAREGHLQTGCGALVVRLSDLRDAAVQRDARVALDLLHTLWIVDRDAWRRAMEDAVGVAIPTSIVTSEMESVAPLTVAVRVENANQATCAQWEALLAPTVRLTEAEANAKLELMQTYGHGTAQVVQAAASQAIPLRLQFHVGGIATSEVQAFVTQAVDMVEAVCNRLGLCGGISPEDTLHVCAPFTLDSLDLDLDQYVMTSGMARQVLRLHAFGIRFHHLRLRLAKAQYEYTIDAIDEAEDRADRDRLLTMLLRPVETTATPRAATARSHFAIETLHISRADLAQFCVACSAFESTRVVKNLQLWDVFAGDSPRDRARKWEQLTRALFAPSSRTSIKHLTFIKADIGMRDIDTVANTLHALAAQSSRGDHALQSLTIDALNGQSAISTIEATPLLLECIGQHIDSLTFTIWMGAYGPDWMIRIQRACPKLCVLHINGGSVDSMDMVLDAYEGPTCQIRTLALGFVEAPNESVAAFARALRDPHRNVSRVLRELSIDFVGAANGLDEPGLDAFLDLLKTPDGSRLEYLAMSMHKLSWVMYHMSFEMYHHTWGTGVAALVPLACKAAFLSVCRSPHQKLEVHRRHPVCDGSAPWHIPTNRMDELNSDVLSLIFQFAAARTWRNVHVDSP